MASLRRLVLSTVDRRCHTYQLLYGQTRHRGRVTRPGVRFIHDKPTSDDGKNTTTTSAAPQGLTAPHLVPDGTRLQEKTVLSNVDKADTPGEEGDPEEGGRRLFGWTSSPLSDAILTTAIGIGIGE
jgi:hypothetical protein